jgi:hypothetical protein
MSQGKEQKVSAPKGALTKRESKLYPPGFTFS